MNAAWHRVHLLAKSASVAERVAWHLAHQEHCACRPIPASLLAHLPREKRRSPAAKSPAIDPAFARVMAAFADDPLVTHGGKGFGSSGLKVKGKLFAMIASSGNFVVKLPKARVEELVRLGKGKPFDPGHGRLMKEWVALDGSAAKWIPVAKEARAFVGG